MQSQDSNLNLKCMRLKCFLCTTLRYILGSHFLFLGDAEWTNCGVETYNNYQDFKKREVVSGRNINHFQYLPDEFIIS